MRLVLLLHLLLLIITQDLFAQCGTRYKERYFNNIQVFRDVVYSEDAPALIGATLTTETTIPKDLVMDVFMPPATDVITKRPVVILAHGGGFINVAFMGGTLLVGTMDNDDVQALADTLAHWGFVTASIEYRLGFNPASASSLKRAVWRGAQDMSAAVRFFRKNATWFGIDSEKVFVGGSSAGAFCAIHSTFVDNAERLPESYQLVPIFKKDLGALHSRPIVELTSFNPFNGNPVVGNDVDSIPIGVAAYWGAIADLDWLHQGSNKAPMIMFHGTGDAVVSYQCNRPFANVILTAPVTCGSYMMDSVMTAHNMPHEVHFENAAGHEYWGALNGNWLPAGPNAFWADIIQKTADYFYPLMQPAKPSITGIATANPTTNYTYSINNPLPNHSYCWKVDGGVMVSPVTNGSTIEVQFYNTTTQGVVTARAVNESQVASDVDSMEVTVLSNVSINAITSPIQSLRFYPNPALEDGWLTLSAKRPFKTTLMIVNSVGQLMVEQALFLKEGKNTLELSLKDLPQGIYMVKVLEQTLKVVKR